ncbi:hypothetical protein ES702_07882 [subsurface metagenome]
MAELIERTPRKKAPDIDKNIPDPSKTCAECDSLADYRVKLVSGIEEYLCDKHFSIKYNYSPPPTPRITYLKIKR